ncbi:serine hydrolase domain-containing protein [Bizionia hallyeonensis]|uniref:Beta-lactamase n=1 Tax=Bizionia hallyeonensis TaxID=1123757 RepID=A0ABW0C5A2_9FLAO
MTKYILLTFLLIVLNCSDKPKQAIETQKNTGNITQIIDSLATKMVQDSLINATSIAIFFNGKEYIQHYGELEKGKGNTPTNNTIYEIGSLSKVLTGTLMAQAVLENKISLEDNITKYLNDGYSNLSFENHPVKIKHVLTHTAGLPNMLPPEMNTIMGDFLNYETPAKINTVLEYYNQTKFLKDLHSIKIDTIPGYKYAYSSTGTELSAHILEIVYKTNFEDLLKKFYSEKVGMAHTKIKLNDTELSQLAVGYHVDNPIITSPMGKLPWGAGGNIKTTVSDMMKFVQYQLENNAIVQESHKSVFQYNDEFGLGYFWNIDKSNDTLGTQYTHHGGVPRSQCFMYIIPEHNMGAFIITNQSGMNTASKMLAILNPVFDELIQQSK